MKKILFSMLAMVAMVSCSSENDPIDEAGNLPVEIKMSAGITTKTPIVSESGLLATTLSGFQFVKAADNASNATWTTTSSVATTGEIDNTGAIKFNTPLLYNADASLKSWLIGYFPTAKTISNGIVTWDIDGKKDILISTLAEGDKTTNKSTAMSVTFHHALTLLKFKFAAEKGAASVWGDIESITIKKYDDVNPDTPKDISTAAAYTLSGSTNNAIGTINYSGTGAIDVYKASSGSYGEGKIDDSTNKITLVDEQTELGAYSIVPPINSDKYALIITTANKSNVVIAITLGSDGTSTAGQAHEVTLTFKAAEISASATITDWVPVTGGQGSIE